MFAALALLPLAAQDRDAFGVEWQRLKRGQTYSAAKTGSITCQFASVEGIAFETLVEIPESYDPARKWPVRVPDVVDFGKPVVVRINGRIAFEGAVAKDRAVLRKWAARDNDRDVLYGAELQLEVK